MGCCGQKREQQLRALVAQSRTTTPDSSGHAPFAGVHAPANHGKAATGGPAGAEVRVRYRQIGYIQVRGSVSRRIYTFSAVRPVQNVDRRDAPELLKMRCFVQA
jgi:hypothetical protein